MSIKNARQQIFYRAFISLSVPITSFILASFKFRRPSTLAQKRAGPLILTSTSIDVVEISGGEGMLGIDSTCCLGAIYSVNGGVGDSGSGGGGGGDGDAFMGIIAPERS